MFIGNLYLASDHAGFELKNKVKDFIQKNYADIKIYDLGCNSLDSCDYPDYAEKTANIMIADPNSMAILLCGTGIGISMAANRFAWIRAALCYNPESAKLSREHNDANILVLPSKNNSFQEHITIIKSFIETDFSNHARHIRRIKKLTNLN